MVTPEPARVRFVEFDDYSKNVEIFAYLDCQDHNVFLAIKEDILLRIEDVIEQAGSGFAFPSQTAYLSRDQGLDDEKSRKAETKVHEWRRSERLPFPEFDEEERDRFENVLDYPPVGSPHYAPRSVANERMADDAAILRPEDFIDLPDMVARLSAGDRVSEFVRDHLSGSTETMLARWDGGADNELKESIVRDLNEMIDGPSIYEEQRFARVELSPETRQPLAGDPKGNELRRLNRLLLQDAFPKALPR
jgi:hypothetical protein